VGIVARARADSSIVLTFDLDFVNVLALGVLEKPGVIIFRLADERPTSVNLPLATVLEERAADLESGARSSRRRAAANVMQSDIAVAATRP
jgi:predicted nuclease of predicted toxin-antitoxin system